MFGADWLPGGRERLRGRLALACAWLDEVAQVREDYIPPEQNPKGYAYEHWRGAMRSEYGAASRRWHFFGPVWHTGQAIKALVMASRVLRDPALQDAARLGAGFVGAQRITDPASEHRGAFLAFEDRGDGSNTSGVLECLDGLLELASATDQDIYWEWAAAALDWVARHAYRPGEGLFLDLFASRTRQFEPPPWTNADNVQGRPLLDDGVFRKGAQRTGSREWRRIFYETADRLLREEDPPGNWVRFAPCNWKAGRLHPRQAYWWGRPMLLAYADSGRSAYLEAAKRVGEWYLGAQRADGGLFRGTYRDLRTDSFGHATSGIACAALLWLDLWAVTREERWLAAAGSALRYCMSVQFTAPQDANLRGAILERVLPPDGTDRSPYHLRDLGTIFFAQAAAHALEQVAE